MLAHMEISDAAPDDLPRLADLWQERMTIIAQNASRFSPGTDHRTLWTQFMRARMSDVTWAIFVAKSPEPVGYIIGRIGDPPDLTASTPGTRRGIIEDIALDVHSYHSGLGRRLYAALCAWFEGRGVGRIFVHAPRYYAVEQAFWRGLGAREWGAIQFADDDISQKISPERIWLAL